MTIDPAEFRRVLGHFPTGVTVVTGAGPVGMAIGSFASVSLEPPLVMFCPGTTSQAWQAIRDTGSFCANILSDRQQDICATFASPVDDRFAGINWTTDVTGSPVLPECLGHIDCDIEAVFDGGDHDIVVGRVRSRVAEGDGEPLVFFKGGYRQLAES